MKIKTKMVLALMAAVLVPAMVAGESTGTDPEGFNTDEQPSYSNPAQAMHAAQLATAAAMQPNEETQLAADSLAAAQDAFDETTSALQNALDDPNADIDALQAAVDAAAESLAAAQAAYAEQIGALAGVFAEDIQAMRQSGMGWGQIAIELGVHPGVLGLGHGKHSGFETGKRSATDPATAISSIDPDEEINEVTRRSVRSTAAMGLGVANQVRNSPSKGLGLAHASDAATTGISDKGQNQGKGAAGRSDSPGAASSGRATEAGSASDSRGSNSSGNNSGRSASGDSSSGPGSSGKGDVGRGNSDRGGIGAGDSGRGNADRGGPGGGNADRGGPGGGNAGGGGLGRK